MFTEAWHAEPLLVNSGDSCTVHTVAHEVTAADIARLAGVGRAAVSNWRRRYPDFPRPVGGQPTSPAFDLDEVQAWLRANGKQVDDARTESTMLPAPARAIGSVQTDLVSVVAGLLPPLRRGVVLDPACGPGTLLAAAAHRLGPGTRYAAQDADPANVQAAIRALADAGAQTAEIAVGSPLDNDTLASYRGLADLVVSLPRGKALQQDEWSFSQSWEFGLSPSVDRPLAWLQVCYSYVKPGGQVLMPMPHASSVRSSGRRVRAELLRSGALRQVIALPEAFGGPAGPWQIWTVRRPENSPTYTVRLVDLTDADTEDIPTDARGWQTVYGDDAVTREVASIQLLDEDVLLVPARHIEPPLRDVGSDYAKLRTGLAKSVAKLDGEMPSFRRSPEPATFPMTTILDLLRAGAIAFVDKDTSLHPGDLLVPSGSDGFDATVVTESMPAGVERGTGEVIRCDEDLVDPYFLACFLRSKANRRQAAGTVGGTYRLDLRRARIPRLPLADQRRYGAAFRRLSAVTDRIESVSALATDALSSAVYGLTSGVFVPEDT